MNELEDAGIDESFFNRFPKKPFADYVDINPKYKKDTNSKKYFVEMADIDEKMGRIKKFESKGSVSSGASKFKNNDVLFARIIPCTENDKVAVVEG